MLLQSVKSSIVVDVVV